MKRLTWSLTLTFDILIWISIGITHSSQTIYILSLKLVGLSFKLHKVKKTGMIFWPWPLIYWPKTANMDSQMGKGQFLTSVPWNAYGTSKSKAWDVQKGGQTMDKVIPLWRFAALAQQFCERLSHFIHFQNQTQTVLGNYSSDNDYCYTCSVTLTFKIWPR